MVSSHRVYMYAVTEDGRKDFLHTALDEAGAVAFLQKHRKLFGNRYVAYFHKTMSEDKEHYIE